MKHKFLNKLIAASVITSTIIALAPVKANAEWIKNYDGNWSYIEGYNFATGWKQISSKWYFFDSLGQMRTGWISSNGEWYYADLSGEMQTGVIQIEGKIHLFAQSGEMQKGSCIVNSKLYYFDDNGVCIGTDMPMPSKGFDYYGNSTVPYMPSQIISQGAKMSSDIPSDGSKQVVQYKVTFKDPDADDDEQLLKTRTIDENKKMLLYKPTKSGYAFVEWNTKDDGDGTGYQYDDSITIKEDITLYAQWEKATETSTSTDTVKVTSIKVFGSNSIVSIVRGASLQMSSQVSPNDATNQAVTWSVSNGTNNTLGEASISTTGKLTAVAIGQVTVKATAADGSGIVGTFVITIT